VIVSAPERAGAGAAVARDAAPRRQVPTHLDVEDRPFAGLTVRQTLCLVAGCAWGYAAWSGWPWLPAPLRLGLTVACVALTVALVAVRPGGRGLAGWGAVVLRHALTPRVAVWRPVSPVPPVPEAPPVSPAAGRPAGGPAPHRPGAPAARKGKEAWEAWAPVAAWARPGPATATSAPRPPRPAARGSRPGRVGLDGEGAR
jgi:hypothetical protein